MKRRILAPAGLVILTLFCLFTLYQVLFDLWMLAYPFVDPHVWRNRLYVRLATLIMSGVSWSALAIWLIRRKRPPNLAQDKDM